MSVPDVDRDVRYLKACAGVLQDYLLSPELYWPAPLSGTGMPRLTIGNILLSEAKVHAAVLAGLDPAAQAPLLDQIEGLRSHWRSTWAAKAGKEISARLTLWQNYLSDMASDRQHHQADYSYQVRLRVMLTLLSAEQIQTQLAEDERLAVMDRKLRELTRPAAFVWEAGLASGFPQERFWFLYRVVN